MAGMKVMLTHFSRCFNESESHIIRGVKMETTKPSDHHVLEYDRLNRSKNKQQPEMRMKSDSEDRVDYYIIKNA